MNAAKALANRKPQLNAYQLGCGYLQIREFPELHVRVTLWHESSHYHVRTTYHDHPDKVGWTTWDNALETLTEARWKWREQVKAVKGGLI